jgi:hypothetical protein
MGATVQDKLAIRSSMLMILPNHREEEHKDADENIAVTKSGSFLFFGYLGHYQQ